ncbi:hypothetical protein [Kribbella deserti]|uniref:2TM domain-containing protein n=1 Tax=Kribbella deserti TaxID=1926257 RepID=A0ABV6QQX4_9ACTN
MLLAIIAACEVGFWVLLATGLAVRYALRMPRLGLVLLAGVPLVDVVMLVASVIDLQRGGEPSFKHSLAAIFIGVSVAFGHQSIKWADRWAAYRFASGPRPVKPPKRGPERARRERQGWYRHLLAWSIGSALMLGGGLLSGGLDTADALLGPAWTWTIVLVIDGFVSFSYGGDKGPDESDRESRAAAVSRS